MADSDNDKQVQQERDRKAAVQKQDEQRRADQRKSDDKQREAMSKPLGDDAMKGLKFSNDEDPRSEEEKQEAIADHDRLKTEMNDDLLDEKLGEYDPEVLGHRYLGGMDICDTRQAAANRGARFAPMVSVRDANLAAKKQLGEENRQVSLSGQEREEQQASLQNRDATARAETIARH